MTQSRGSRITSVALHFKTSGLKKEQIEKNDLCKQCYLKAKKKKKKSISHIFTSLPFARQLLHTAEIQLHFQKAA